MTQDMKQKEAEPPKYEPVYNPVTNKVTGYRLVNYKPVQNWGYYAK